MLRLGILRLPREKARPELDSVPTLTVHRKAQSKMKTRLRSQFQVQGGVHGVAPMFAVYTYICK